jgi:hypothetical protein
LHELSIADEQRVRQKAEEIAREIEKRFAEDIARIRTRFDEDWTGEAFVYLNVVLSDAAVKRQLGKKLSPSGMGQRDIFSQVREAAWNAFDQSEMNSIPAVHFRSESEAAEIRDKYWD